MPVMKEDAQDPRAKLEQEKERIKKLGKSEGGVKKHVVGPGDTLSGLAKKYYGKAAYKLWMHIYEANKETIGDDPNVIRDGDELVIPPLTAELKKELED